MKNCLKGCIVLKFYYLLKNGKIFEADFKIRKMKKRSIFLTIFFFSIFVRTLKYANMIRISNTSSFRFCWKNGKLDWPKCARTCVPESFFFLLFAAKIERRSSGRDERVFSRSSRSRLRRQTTGKKTLWHPGYRTSFLRCTMCTKKNPSFKILQRNMCT